MSHNYLNPKNSLSLFELNDKLNFLLKLYKSKSKPKVLMLTGNKGSGKSTIINHLMHSIYDSENYDFSNKFINCKTIFYKEYSNNVFSNIIYLSGNDFKNVKINDIRMLKSNLLKTTISSKERYIILDDVELFNVNSLNALLKTIEEPTDKNYFILINNKTKKLIDTIYSRCLEIKIKIKNDIRIKIIESLIKENNLEALIDFRKYDLSPGNFLNFNNLLNLFEININDPYLLNLQKISNLFRKNKDINFINLLLFLTDQYFYTLHSDNNETIEKIIENKSFVINNLNKFYSLNLNQNAVFNAISYKLSNG